MIGRRASEEPDTVPLGAVAARPRVEPHTDVARPRGDRGEDLPPPRGDYEEASPGSWGGRDEDLLVGRYALGRRLGAGGFGAVYEAEDRRLGRWVAVKLMDAAASSPERARREAMAAARLDHPAIVAVFDAGETASARYLVSELVTGRTLAELDAADELSDRDVLRIGLALTGALTHAHARGVVHRDLKPQNVMVPDAAEHDARDGRPAAKLADFGVAWLSGDAPLTQVGDIVGTLAYMAPEQAAGAPVDERADVYSLALVLYEALAGVNPVRAGSPAATVRRVGMVLPALAGARPDLPRGLCAAIDRGLAPDPDDRATLADLDAALTAALGVVSDAGGQLAPHASELGPWRLPPWGLQLLSAVASGSLVAAGLEVAARMAAAGGAAPDLPLDPLPAGAAIAMMAALYPRGGWLAGVGVVLVALWSAGAGGLAGLVLTAAAAPVALLRRSGRLWSLLALAPLLAAVGAAAGFVAACGRARDWRVRAGAGAAGAWWLLLAAPWLPPVWPAVAATRGASESSLADAGAAGEAVVEQAVRSGGVVLVGVWALAAVILPWLVRGRGAGADWLAAAIWSGALATGTGALTLNSGGPGGGFEPRELAVGFVVGTLAARWGIRSTRDTRPMRPHAHPPAAPGTRA